MSSLGSPNSLVNSPRNSCQALTAGYRHTCTGPVPHQILTSPRHSSHYQSVCGRTDSTSNSYTEEGLPCMGKGVFSAAAMPCWQRRDSIDSNFTYPSAHTPTSHGATMSAKTTSSLSTKFSTPAAAITSPHHSHTPVPTSATTPSAYTHDDSVCTASATARSGRSATRNTVQSSVDDVPVALVSLPASLTQNGRFRSGTDVDADDDDVALIPVAPTEPRQQPAMYGVIKAPSALTNPLSGTLTRVTPADATIPMASPCGAKKGKIGSGLCTDITPIVATTSESFNGQTSASSSALQDTHRTGSSKSPSETTPARVVVTHTTRRPAVVAAAPQPTHISVPSRPATGKCATTGALVSSPRHRDVAAACASLPSSAAATAVCPRVAQSPSRVSSPARKKSQSQPSDANLVVRSSPTNGAARKLPAPLSFPTFIASRAVLQGFVQRWRNKYEENKSCYREGGYLNVSLGKPLHGRYVMIQKLGWGEFSTVWLAYDTKHATHGRGPAQAFVAVKIAKCHATVHESSLYEIGLLRYVNAKLSTTAPVTNLIDTFEVTGEYGRHLCMVMPVHGSNLLAIIDQLKARKTVRAAEERLLLKECLASTLTGLSALHTANVIHTDIKPENVLCNAPDPRVLTSMETFCQKNCHRTGVITPEMLREHVLGTTGASDAQKGADGSNVSSSSSSSPCAGPTSSQQQHLVCLADFGLSAVLEPASATEGSSNSSAEVTPTEESPMNGDSSAAGPSAERDTSALKRLLSRLVTSKKEFPVMEPGRVRNRHGVLIQTREYRAPEVLLGLDFTTATDVWSVGCMAFEMITGEFLMDPKKRFMGQPRSSTLERQIDIEHMAMIQQLLGPVPEHITSLRTRFNAYYEERKTNPRVSATKYAKPNATVRRPPVYIHRFIDDKGRFIYADYYASLGWAPRRHLDEELRPFLGEREATLAADFILQCLGSYDPTERSSAEAMLCHPWLRGVAKTLTVTPTASSTNVSS